MSVKGESTMLNWMARYRNASSQTKFLIWNLFAYGLVIALTTAYCYGRLDFVRSYKMSNPQAETK